MTSTDRIQATTERELADRYATDPRLNPDARVRSRSPTGRLTLVDLRTREARAAS